MQDHRPSAVSYHQIGGRRLALRRWGASDGPPLLLLHGSRDNSITFQFLVDALGEDWQILAPDLRGHGLSDPVPAIWQHELLGDVCQLIRDLLPERPVPVVGHSMGGNLALALAALRPGLVSHVVSLDALGTPPNTPLSSAAAVLGKYLDELEHKGFRTLRGYSTIGEMTDRLVRANPRLGRQRAEWLARHSSRHGADGLLYWLHDINLSRSLGLLYNDGEWDRLFQRIACPVLYLASSDPTRHDPATFRSELTRKSRCIATLDWDQLPETGHNLHHELPDVMAGRIETFLSA
ncbi:alpha/beta hydrolase [Gemmobacter sp.]|uniref:alpha/beta fold hydrolase n=1 Tax=Gemmobacter sp. TaxID=1898957 RepID=UPI002AFF5D86|nr:alpha/beta hydrolase [Gemmobacter sp.]